VQTLTAHASRLRCRRPPEASVRSTTSALEPISPELVLVDPELARAERARLDERARLAELALLDERRSGNTVEALAEARAPEAAANARTRPVEARVLLAPTLLALGLFVSGVVGAVLLVGNRHTSTQRPRVAGDATAIQTKNRPTIRSNASTEAGRAEELRTTKAAVAARTRSVVLPAPKSRRRAVRRSTSAVVAGRVLSLVLRSPRSKLPKRLIDPATGLAKTNLQAVCRALQNDGAFLCVLSVPLGGRRQELRVLYRPGSDGRGTLTWYRSGGR
jgi:hypothetical protein